MWSVSSILAGLQSFFYSEEATSGSVACSRDQRRQLARDSLAHCARSPAFVKLFPELLDQQQALRAEAALAPEPQTQAPPPVMNVAAAAALAAFPLRDAPPPAEVAVALVPQAQQWRAQLTTLACVGAVLAVLVVPLLSIDLSG